MSNSLIGHTLGHYRIVDELGAGGMGVVYKAQDIQLGRMVALKVLPEGSASDEESTERFRREARTASSLNHPNICTIYGFDEHGGQLYLAMELLEGESLETRLTRGPLDLAALIDIGAQIAEGLDAAHAEGILHRDIKPANIYLTKRGQVKVLDFGLAKLAPHPANRQMSRSAQPTERFSSMIGTTVGTVSYMSPEQARGEDVDPRTDLFSFGVVLYEMATGQQGFSGTTTAVVFDGILNRDPAPPSTLNGSLPEDLDRIVSKAIEKDRTLRYQSAADIRADLLRLRRDSGSRRVPAAVSHASGAYAASASGVHAVSSSSRTAAITDPQAGVPVATARRGVSPMLVAGGVILLLGAGALYGVSRYVTQGPSAPATPETTTVDAPPSPESAAPEALAAPAAADTVAVAPPTADAGADAPAAAEGVPAAGIAAPAQTAPVTVPPAATKRTPAPATAPRPAPTATAPAPPAPDATPKVDPAKAAEAARLATAEADAAERLDIARAKLQNNLLEPALTDFRQILSEYPDSGAATDAAFLIAEVLEKQNKLEDAMAAHIEFGRRFPSNARIPASKLRLAELTARSRRPDRENATRDLLAALIRDHPRTPQTYQALQMKLRLDGERRPRELDPALGIQVPAVVPTLRLLTEQFPSAPASQNAFVRLAEAYESLQQYERAAQAFSGLATNFPASAGEGWFRAGEVYERRLKDMARARDAYGRVPEGSPRYRDAQRKLRDR